MDAADGVPLTRKALKIFEQWCAKSGAEGRKREEALEKFVQLVAAARYEPGEAVGIIAAQSISEPATQMTMRSYTLATQRDRLSKVTQGLPRLVEIFDARKTFEKNMKIYLKPEYNNRETATAIAEKIKLQKVVDVIASDSIDLAGSQIELELRSAEDTEKVKASLSRENLEVNTRGNRVYVKPKKGGIRGLRNQRNKTLSTQIEGIKGIEAVVVVKDGEDWMLQTAGTNLRKVLQIPEVDQARVVTNDLHQVLEVLGIEAARNAILQEAKATLDDQGLDVDIRHLLLLADTMTADGEIKPIGRYGVSGGKASVLARANFEETKKHIVNASFYGEEDMLVGVIENVLVGGIVPVGTGMVRIGIDVEKLKGVKKE